MLRDAWLGSAPGYYWGVRVCVCVCVSYHERRLEMELQLRLPCFLPSPLPAYGVGEALPPSPPSPPFAWQSTSTSVNDLKPHLSLIQRAEKTESLLVEAHCNSLSKFKVELKYNLLNKSVASSTCTVKGREWLEFVLHSYYGSLILDAGLGALLRVGVLMSVRCGWHRMWGLQWAGLSDLSDIWDVFMCMSNTSRYPLLFLSTGDGVLAAHWIVTRYSWSRPDFVQ